jgi:hypothetical protein
MKVPFTISAIAACALISGAALADSPRQKNRHHGASSGSVAAGAAIAGPRGGTAVGGAGNVSMTSNTRCAPSTASTTSNNATYTDRRRASGASSTSGTASGSGAVSANSDGGSYSATDRMGSEADTYGTSNATARNSRRC